MQLRPCPAQLVMRKFNPLLGMSAAAYEEAFGLQLDFGEAGGAETRAVTDANKAEYVTARHVVVQYISMSACQHVGMSACQHIAQHISAFA